MIRKFDSAAKERFLETLASTNDVRQSAKAAGISTETAYRHRKRNPVFRSAWKTALEYDENLLRWVTLGRIQEGYETPIYYRGEKIDTIRKYDDALLLGQLKQGAARLARRDAQDAAKAAPVRDELSEILELINGKTRRIRARQ